MAAFLRPATAESQVPGQPRAELVRPALDVSWTNGSPDARGDGAAMSGVGLDLVIRAGVRGAIGPLRYRLVPQLIANENRDFQTFAAGDPARDGFSSPFYFGDFSADLPSRPGDGRYLRLALGESGLWWSDRRTFVGVLATTPRWGPREGEGLVLGRSAPGLPRLELAAAWRPPAGLVRVRWLAGVANEGDWFDADEGNDSRIVSGARVEYERGEWLALGFARTVMSVAGRGTVAAAFQPFARGSTDSAMEIVSADLLLYDTRAGIRAWLELARQEPIRGMREVLESPTEGIAFRSGLTQRLRRSTSAEWSASVEFVRLDQSGTRSGTVPNDLYTSAVVVQGWTHLGQPLGSGLGPGGQRQFARLDRAGRTWRLGAFAERARWNEDALFRQAAPASDRHDVTLQLGLVASRMIHGHEVTATISGGRRLDYLFQGASSTPGGEPVDLDLLRFGLSFSPSATARRIVGVFPEP